MKVKKIPRTNITWTMKMMNKVRREKSLRTDDLDTFPSENSGEKKKGLHDQFNEELLQGKNRS